MRIGVIGAGISGLGAALALSEEHEVFLIEKDARFGGHANTARIDYDGVPLAVDTGFIVFNQRNYPNFCGLLEHLDVASHWSDMSFGFSQNDGGFEYACDDLDKLFAQRGNVANPGHVRMLLQILRFNRTARTQLKEGALSGLTLGEWLQVEGYGKRFRDRFVLPMGGAIWSTSVTQMLDFPAENFVAFFENHDLMTGLDPAQRWRTVTGGSRNYVRSVVRKLGPRAQIGVGAKSVRREAGRVVVGLDDGGEAQFDHVILATHADQSLTLLQDADDQERRLLSAFPFSKNTAVLHRDPALMPRRKKVWSSWNFLSDGADRDAERPAQVTYWMNRLQGLPEEHPLFVSLNPDRMPDPALTFGEYQYDHPLFSREGFTAQGSMDLIQGRRGVWYAGAWLGYGFHEDGLRAGLRAAAALGARPDWARDLGGEIAANNLRAAE